MAKLLARYVEGNPIGDRTRFLLVRCSVLLAPCLTIWTGLPAPSSPTRSAAPPTVLLADLTFRGDAANSIDPGDSRMAQVATEHLRAAFGGSNAVTLVDSARAAEALASLDRRGVACSASVDCVRDAARRVGARWAVTGAVSKVSNLIWYLTGQLVDVESGWLLLDDGFELKGSRDDMVPRGAASLARRIEAAAIRAAKGARGEPRAGRRSPRS